MKAGPEPTPDELLIDGIIASMPTRTQRHSFAVNTTTWQDTVMKQAARERNMSITAYVRRATLAMAAFDLGLTLEEALAGEQTITPFEGQGPRRRQDPTTTDFGPWRIEKVTQ